MGFPPAGAQIYYNEAGEVIDWDIPAGPEYDDICGGYHPPGECPLDNDEDDDEDGQLQGTAQDL